MSIEDQQPELNFNTGTENFQTTSQKAPASRIKAGKAVSQKNFKMDSSRAMSKMTKTTAASVNQTRNGQFGTQSATGDISRNKSFKQRGLVGKSGAASAVGYLVKPHS